MLGRPASGRAFFEQIIGDNLDLGRPGRIGLTFDRRVTRRTSGRFRSRVTTHGVIPSLHFDYKHSRIKQYHKEGRALRTETTINSSRDFAIGKRLRNLSELRKVGFEANRRLVSVQEISHDCTLGEEAFQSIHQPTVVEGQRGSALRFGDARVLALLSALVMYCHLARGFTNKELREHVAQLLGLPLASAQAQAPPASAHFRDALDRVERAIDLRATVHTHRLVAAGAQHPRDGLDADAPALEALELRANLRRTHRRVLLLQLQVRSLLGLVQALARVLGRKG
ncbi:MAG: hypothetical protein OEZ06_11660 [Myxococcales bacterium]|nr:hypothetical protein [Myxococcales bacterium]